MAQSGFQKSPAKVFKRFSYIGGGVVLAAGVNYPALATLGYNVGGIKVNNTTYSAAIPLFTIPAGFICSITTMVTITAIGGALATDTISTGIVGVPGGNCGTYGVMAVPAALPGLAAAAWSTRDCFVIQASGAEPPQISPNLTYSGAGAPVVTVRQTISLWSFK